MAEGVDLYSRYQSVTSWPAARKAGKQFAYLKVGEGTGTRSVAALSPAAARQSGVVLGGYWYAQPGDAVAQANMLVNQAQSLGLTGLAPALDLESPFAPNQGAINFAVAFCRQVAARGHRPCLYANNSMMRVLRPAVLAAVPQTLIWVARYGANPTVAYTTWQYSDAGHVAGIKASSVDLNKGAIPTNANITPQATQQVEGFVEAMAFGDTFKDWAGNTQSVKGWMDLQDKGRWELRNRIFGLWQQALPNPWYDKNNRNGADIRSHQTYTAQDWLAGANLKSEQALSKLDDQAKTITELRTQIDTLTEAIETLRDAVAPHTGGQA